jgi:RNA polymerase sigma factor (sigma-70 family)
MGTIEQTDAMLVEASQRGELEAFGHLVARYQDVVCAVGYSSTGDRVLGEDVAQETFLAAWRQLDRVRDVMRLRPWLCGIARNLGRKAKKRTHREQLVEADEPVASSPSAFDELARGDTERIVREALARVPETYREVLVLYYREDQSIREVAETLGVSEDAVMQRLSRGRRYLADSVTALVERSLKQTRPRRDLVAAVLGAIAAFTIPSRVDASVVKTKAKGSTMLKMTLAATALAAAGTTAYFWHAHGDTPSAPTTTAAKPLLHYGAGPARPPTLGPSLPKHTTVARRTAAADLGMLPADADVVFGIDMARIQSSALWKQFVAPGLVKASGLQSFAERCGFDPLAALSAVTIGLEGVGKDAMTGTIVVHGPDKAKVMACVAQDDNGRHKIIDGDIVEITDHRNGDYGMTFKFIDNNTALVVIGEVANAKDQLAKAAANDSGLATSPAFAELFANIDSDDPLWLVIGPSSSLFSESDAALAQYGAHMSALYGSIDVTDSLVIAAGMRLGSPDQVSRLVALAQTEIDKVAQAGTLAQYFTQLDVNADGNDLIVSIAANTLQLMNIAATKSVHASATPATPAHSGTFEVSATIPGPDTSGQ